MTTIRTVMLADMPAGVLASAAFPDTDGVTGMIFYADEIAAELLAAEQPDARFDVDEVVPEITIADAEGRPFRAARLEREDNTNRFTIHLLTEES